VKIREAYRFIVQAIQMRRLQNWVAVPRDIAIPLIVGQNQNDVRLARLSVSRRKRKHE
jgi:hypothetical protein